VVGPMARSVRDLRLLLSVLEAGPITARSQANPELKDLRVALWTEEQGFVLDAPVKAAVEAFGAELARHGAQVEPATRFIDMAALLPAYRTLLAGLLAQDLPAAQLRAMRRMRPLARLAAAMGADDDTWAGLALAYTVSHLDWLAADEVRARAAARVREVFARFDVILAPIAPVPPFPHDHRPFGRRRLTLSNGTTAPYLAALRWIALATACGLPATAIPVGATAEGLPIGAQLIGPRGSDSRTLAIAEAIEARLGGFAPPPSPPASGGPTPLLNRGASAP
jgi:amidase